MHDSYLDSARKQFAYHKMLGDKTFPQMPAEQLFWQPNGGSNSIAMTVKHLWGNMLSRWTHFLTSDGEKEWRNRDAEFQNDIQTKEDLLEKWEAGWSCLFGALQHLRNADLEREIFIRNEGHSVVEAINRQLCHYAYHVGQIVFLGKMVCNENWNSLSIPKNKSVDYNRERFSREKASRHFPDAFLGGNASDTVL